jgi:peptidoglycan hydrolase-like protein with peptidoglycan-binding domain
MTAHPPSAFSGPVLDVSLVTGAQRAVNLLRQAGVLAVPKPLAEDGRLGPYTRQALAAFQHSVSLPTTGGLDGFTKLWLTDALRSVGVQAYDGTLTQDVAGGIPMVTIGSIVDVQRALNRLNLGTLKEDGVLGSTTRQAIVELQKTYMMPPTGQADHQTRSLIAQALGQIGISAFVPATETGGLSAASGPLVDRSAQIQQQALGALLQLREIGVTAVAESLRHLLAEPSVANLHQAVAFLATPSSGAFANQVAALWKPVLDSYAAAPDPDAALRAAIPSQMAPLLAQVDGVLTAINQLAAYPTVDNLSRTVSSLSRPEAGALGAKIAQPLKAFLTTVTAPT